MLDGVLVTGLAWKPSHRMGLQGGGTELQLKLRGGGFAPSSQGRARCHPAHAALHGAELNLGPTLHPSQLTRPVPAGVAARNSGVFPRRMPARTSLFPAQPDGTCPLLCPRPCILGAGW